MEKREANKTCGLTSCHAARDPAGGKRLVKLDKGLFVFRPSSLQHDIHLYKKQQNKMLITIK